MSQEAAGTNTDGSTTDGPHFEDLQRGQTFCAPAVTLTSGFATAHQVILGDRLRVALDHRLAGAVVGDSPVAHPGLVWDLSIGQSTVVTRRVLANLFYRGLVLRRLPLLGDTLTTTTEVVALRENRRRPDRRPTGLVALRVTTLDTEGRTVLDFWRCAMLPLRDPDTRTGHNDDLDVVGRSLDHRALTAAVDGWNLKAFRHSGSVPGDLPRAGRRWQPRAGDVVSSAPELARLTLNIAGIHHDATLAGGQRLVYGGHTIGLALTQACRVLPNLVTVTGWHSCDHLGPVHEGDTLHSEISVEHTEPIPTGHSFTYAPPSRRVGATSRPAQCSTGGTPPSSPDPPAAVQAWPARSQER